MTDMNMVTYDGKVSSECLQQPDQRRILSPVTVLHSWVACAACNATYSTGDDLFYLCVCLKRGVQFPPSAADGALWHTHPKWADAGAFWSLHAIVLRTLCSLPDKSCKPTKAALLLLSSCERPPLLLSTLTQSYLQQQEETFATTDNTYSSQWHMGPDVMTNWTLRNPLHLHLHLAQHGTALNHSPSFLFSFFVKRQRVWPWEIAWTCLFCASFLLWCTQTSQGTNIKKIDAAVAWKYNWTHLIFRIQNQEESKMFILCLFVTWHWQQMF